MAGNGDGRPGWARRWPVPSVSVIEPTIGASAALTTTYLRWHGLSDKHISWGGKAALQDLAWPAAVTLTVVPLMAALWPTDIAESLKDR